MLGFVDQLKEFRPRLIEVVNCFIITASRCNCIQGFHCKNVHQNYCLTIKHADRDEAIAQAYASGGYGMKEIGDHFGLHYSRVSRILAEVRLAKRKT